MTCLVLFKRSSTSTGCSSLWKNLIWVPGKSTWLGWHSLVSHARPFLPQANAFYERVMKWYQRNIYMRVAWFCYFWGISCFSFLSCTTFFPDSMSFRVDLLIYILLISPRDVVGAVIASPDPTAFLYVRKRRWTRYLLQTAKPLARNVPLYRIILFNYWMRITKIPIILSSLYVASARSLDLPRLDLLLTFLQGKIINWLGPHARTHDVKWRRAWIRTTFWTWNN